MDCDTGPASRTFGTIVRLGERGLVSHGLGKGLCYPLGPELDGSGFQGCSTHSSNVPGLVPG